MDNIAVSLTESFRTAISSAGITPPATVLADGRLHRFSTNGTRGDDSGWYVFYDDDFPAGAFGDWRSGVQHTVCVRGTTGLNPTERQAHHRRIEEIRKQREQEEVRRHDETAATATELWGAMQPAPEDHPYLIRKGVSAHQLRIFRGDLSIGGLPMDGALVVPIRDEHGVLWSLEFIADDGEKRFLPGGKKKGCFHLLGEIGESVCIAEGFATGASVHQGTDLPVAIAFDAGNLQVVAESIQKKHPDVRIILCGDNDESGIGQNKAREAAQAVSGTVVIPEKTGDDWNDVHQRDGVAAVRAAVVQQLDVWPNPMSLASSLESEPYPIDALPDGIRQAVEEVQMFTQSPVALVAASALATLSLAGQSRIDVKRADRLTGPTSLFFLSLADSGERKSTTDNMFSAPIREYDRKQAEDAKPDLQRYGAQYASWNAEREGILTAIKQAAKGGKPTDDLKQKLGAHESRQPTAPRVPQLLHVDATPEHLAYTLAHKYPSAGVLTAEAGLVFGSHGMGTDSIMRYLALLNALWDGGSLQVGRRTSESFTVRGARLSMGLQVQAPTLQDFLKRTGSLARGTGFLARFLIAWPESTQGSRTFKEAPTTLPTLDAFHRRIMDILNMPPTIDQTGALEPALVSMTPEAKAAWVAFHDGIEVGLRTGGELSDVRDVASKSADNAARLAALFHLFCSNVASSSVSVENMEAGCRLAAWYLSESRRFFGEMVLPAELTLQAELDAWLIRYCRQEGVSQVPLRVILQYGPNKLRNKTALLAAARELEELHRLRLVGGKVITVNPALLAGMEGT